MARAGVAETSTATRPASAANRRAVNRMRFLLRIDVAPGQGAGGHGIEVDRIRLLTTNLDGASRHRRDGGPDPITYAATSDPPLPSRRWSSARTAAAAGLGSVA